MLEYACGGSGGPINPSNVALWICTVLHLVLQRCQDGPRTHVTEGKLDPWSSSSYVEMVAPKPWLKDWSTPDEHYEELLLGVGTAHMQGSRLVHRADPFGMRESDSVWGLFALLRDELKRPFGAVFRTDIKDIHGRTTSYLVSLASFVLVPHPTSSQWASPLSTARVVESGTLIIITSTCK